MPNYTSATGARIVSPLMNRPQSAGSQVQGGAAAGVPGISGPTAGWSNVAQLLASPQAPTPPRTPATAPAPTPLPPAPPIYMPRDASGTPLDYAWNYTIFHWDPASGTYQQQPVAVAQWGGIPQQLKDRGAQVAAGASAETWQKTGVLDAWAKGGGGGGMTQPPEGLIDYVTGGIPRLASEQFGGTPVNPRSTTPNPTPVSGGGQPGQAAGGAGGATGNVGGTPGAPARINFGGRLGNSQQNPSLAAYQNYITELVGNVLQRRPIAPGEAPQSAADLHALTSGDTRRGQMPSGVRQMVPARPWQSAISQPPTYRTPQMPQTPPPGATTQQPGPFGQADPSYAPPPPTATSLTPPTPASPPATSASASTMPPPQYQAPTSSPFDERIPASWSTSASPNMTNALARPPQQARRVPPGGAPGMTSMIRHTA